MKSRVVIVTGIAVLLGLLALVGGLLHESFCRFIPTAQMPSRPFTLSIAPEFTKGGSSGLQTVLPFLLRRITENTSDPRIHVDLTAYSDVYGYDDKQTITLTALDVTNEEGTVFNLIAPGNSRVFQVDHSGFGHRREDLGPVHGERLTMRVQGFALTASGSKVSFDQTDGWSVHRSTRTGLAILRSE